MSRNLMLYVHDLRRKIEVKEIHHENTVTYNLKSAPLEVVEQFHETPLDSNAIDKYPAKIEQRND